MYRLVDSRSSEEETHAHTIRQLSSISKSTELESTEDVLNTNVAHHKVTIIAQQLVFAIVFQFEGSKMIENTLLPDCNVFFGGMPLPHTFFQYAVTYR